MLNKKTSTTYNIHKYKIYTSQGQGHRSKYVQAIPRNVVLAVSNCFATNRDSITPTLYPHPSNTNRVIESRDGAIRTEKDEY